MEFLSVLDESKNGSPRRTPPRNNDNVAGSAENPLKKLASSSWFIPMLTVIVLIVFLGSVWIYNNYSKNNTTSDDTDDTDVEDRFSTLSDDSYPGSKVTLSIGRDKNYLISDYNPTTPA